MRTTLMTRFLLIGWIALAATTTQGQEIRKTLRDYRWDHPFVYQPSDPFVRSKTFQRHTGHYGLFYNCDNEECKRYSPHICWKTHWENDFPNWMRPFERLRHEWCQTKQRITDGAGMCAGVRGCQCQNCQMAESMHPTGCGCDHCAQAPAPEVREQGIRVAQRQQLPIIRRAADVQPAVDRRQQQSLQTSNANLEHPSQPVARTSSARAGLISGHSPTALYRQQQPQPQAEVAAPLQTPSLLDRLTQSRQSTAQGTVPSMRPTYLKSSSPEPRQPATNQRWIR